MNFTKYWTIADTHFGHDKIVEYHPVRSQNFSEKILKCISNTPFRQGDIFIHLGDVCFGNDKEWHEKLIQSIPPFVNKWLILGNHDKKSISWYYRMGWNLVCENITLNIWGKIITFSHYPLYGVFDFVNYDVKDFVNVHGHTHDNRYNIKSYHVCISIEKNGYCPVNMRKIIEKRG